MWVKTFRNGWMGFLKWTMDIFLLFSRPCCGEIGGFCCERFSVFNFFFCLKFRSMEACSNWLDSVQNR